MTVLTAARARTVQDGPEQCLFQPPLSSTPDWNQYLHSSPCKPWINVGSADPSNPFSIESAHTHQPYSLARSLTHERKISPEQRPPSLFPLHGSQPFFSFLSNPLETPCVPRESRRPLAALLNDFSRVSRGVLDPTRDASLSLSLVAGRVFRRMKRLNDDNMRIRVRYCNVFDRTRCTRVKATLN